MLTSGAEQRCPRCGSWHVLGTRGDPDAGTAYERKMLYVTCRGDLYFAGSIGNASPYPLRPSTEVVERIVIDDLDGPDGNV